MAVVRIQKETLYLRHNFTSEERLKMGDELAAAYGRLESIDTEEAVVKAQFKERRATVDQTVTSLSRNLANGFEMQNVPCTIEYDAPNAFEKSYFRTDTNELVKTVPMTEQERQIELPLEQSAEESAKNIGDFFGKEAPDSDVVVVSADELEAEQPPAKELTESQKVAAAKNNLKKM